MCLVFTSREPSGKKRKRKKPLETADDFILIDALHSTESAFVEPNAPSPAHNFTVNILVPLTAGMIGLIV